MRRLLAQRDIDDLLALAARGGIGQATALTDCVAEGPDQLMYMTDDPIVLLVDDGDEFLAFCEGEVGWVKRANIALGACASSSSPTSPSILQTPRDLHDLQSMTLDGIHYEDSVEEDAPMSGSHPSVAALKGGATTDGGRYSGPFELDSSPLSLDGDAVRSQNLVNGGTLDAGPGGQLHAPLGRDLAHARTTSEASTASSTYSSGSGSIGGFVLGGPNEESSQLGERNPAAQLTPATGPFGASTVGFSPFGTYAPVQTTSRVALPPLRNLGAAAENVRSVQRVNYATTAPIKRQSLKAETAQYESSSSDISPMAEVSEEAEEGGPPTIDVRAGSDESPSPPTRPPRRRPVDLSIVRNSQFSDSSTARISDSPAPLTPRSLDTFGGDGLQSREHLISPDRSIKSGGTRDSELRTSYVGGMFNGEAEANEDRTEALLSPRHADLDEEGRFSLAYLRDSYGSDSDNTPRPAKFQSPIASKFIGLSSSASPPASSESFEGQGVPRLRATPSQDGTEETVLDTPQSAPVSSFGKQSQPRVVGDQRNEQTSLAAPLIIDERPTIDHLDKGDSPTSLNSRYSVESQAAAKAGLRDNFYALGHSPPITSEQQQTWKDLSANLASAVQRGSPSSPPLPLLPNASPQLNTQKVLPRPPPAVPDKNMTPPPGQPRRKASLDAIRSSPRSDERHRMVFTSQSANDAGVAPSLTGLASPMEERLDDRSSHGWSHSPAFPQQRQAPVFNSPVFANGNGSATHLVDTRMSPGVNRTPPLKTPPMNGTPWAQQRSMTPQGPPPERTRPTTPDQRILPNSEYSRRIMSPSSSDDHHVQVVARPLDAFQQPPRNLAGDRSANHVEYGKLSLSTPNYESRPPIPAFHEQQQARRGGTPTPGDRPSTPNTQRARSRSFSAALAKTMGRGRKNSFDMPMPKAVVDSARQRPASPSVPPPNLESDRDPSQMLQLPTARVRPGYTSQASVMAIHHMPIDGDAPPFEPPQQPFLGHGRSASVPRPSVDTLPPRPSTSMRGQYMAGVSHRDYADPTVRTDGMEFELVQPRKASNGAPMVTLQLDTTDLSFGGLLSSLDHSGSESSHGKVQSSENHVDLTTPPEVDEWGFIRDCSPTPVIFRSRQPVNEVRAAEQKWLDIIAKPIPYNGSAPKKVRRLVIEQGVPASLRGRVWNWYMSNGLSGRVDGLFARLLTNEPGEFDEQINCDVTRVYCDHGAFWRRNSPGQQDLRTLLRAYVHFAPSGYRSELALIAGALLIHAVMEDAFWLMAGLFNGTLKTYYVKDKSAFKVDLHVFAGILAGSEPQLANLFRDVDIAPQEYLRNWWMSLYIRSLPWPTVMRFFDTLISEGPRYMFISALAVLTLSRDRLLALPRDKRAVLGYLTHLPQDSLLLPDNFMRACDAVKLREEDLKKMRASVKETLRERMGPV